MPKGRTVAGPAPKPDSANLERALSGTSQQIMNIMASDGWSSPIDRAELLADLRQRLNETSHLIGEWLDSRDQPHTP
jgi:hypothetical protein